MDLTFFWIVVLAALGSAEDDMAGGTPAPETSVRQSLEVCAGEQEYVQKRKEIILEAFNRLGINASADLLPHIALLGSGGGQRAAMALAGSLSQLEKDGLLDSMLYLGGISGSVWSMASLYSDPAWSLNMRKALDHLMGPGVAMEKVQSWLQNRTQEDTFSLTDIWGMVTSALVMKKMDQRRLSEEASRNATNPYPVYSAIEKTCNSEESTAGSWFEFTPHEAGFTDLGLFVETSLLGSKFNAGALLEEKPEMDMVKLQGFCGSAMADMETNMEYIPSWLKAPIKLLEGAKQYLTFYKALGKINSLFRGCPKDPQEQASLDKLHQDLADKDLEHRNESSGLQDDEQTYFQMFIQGLTATLNSTVQSLEDGPQKEFYSLVLEEVLPKLVKWEWGTIHNFLNKFQSSRLPSCLRDTENLYLEDAGLMMNVPYPPFLGGKRNVNLVIALDFSTGKIFETLTQARDYAARLKKPFPEIQKQALEEKEWPKDLYVFEGKEKEPTIVYLPLFNRQNCKDAVEVQEKMKEFSTFQRPYSEDKIDAVIKIAKENMKRNKNALLREIGKAALRAQTTVTEALTQVDEAEVETRVTESEAETRVTEALTQVDEAEA